MPGMTEVLPYLHVSTYKSWNDVGRWWWGLVHDQLYADDHLKRVVAQLKQGAKDERELVERVYGWVIENTRYVALEFGIHGFLPYRVPEVVRRGFGDCKDKASLIYTMLREAGVDARLVLVRTRRNGAIAEAARLARGVRSRDRLRAQPRPVPRRDGRAQRHPRAALRRSGRDGAGGRTADGRAADARPCYPPRVTCAIARRAWSSAPTAPAS